MASGAVIDEAVPEHPSPHEPMAGLGNRRRQPSALTHGRRVRLLQPQGGCDQRLRCAPLRVCTPLKGDLLGIGAAFQQPRPRSDCCHRLATTRAPGDHRCSTRRPLSQGLDGLEKRGARRCLCKHSTRRGGWARARPAIVIWAPFPSVRSFRETLLPRQRRPPAHRAPPARCLS